MPTVDRYAASNNFVIVITPIRPYLVNARLESVNNPLFESAYLTHLLFRLRRNTSNILSVPLGYGDYRASKW